MQRWGTQRWGMQRWGAVALGGLLLAVGCSSPLDKGRTAWAEGTGDFAVAEPHYQAAIDKGNDESADAAEELYEIHMQLATANKKDKPKQAEEH
jgi:hypothetical protein